MNSTKREIERLVCKDAAEAASGARPVGFHLKSMRAARGISIDELSRASGVEHATLVDIEQEKRVPSLGLLWRIAVGLRVPFSELLRGNGECASLLRRGDAQPLESADGQLRSRPLALHGSFPAVEVYELTLRAKAVHVSEPHATGTGEVVIVLSGVLRVRVDPCIYDLSAGDSLTFRADSSHVYENPGDVDAVYHNLILYSR